MAVPHYLIEVPHFACRECHAHSRAEWFKDKGWCVYDGHHAGCEHGGPRDDPWIPLPWMNEPPYVGEIDWDALRAYGGGDASDA